MLENKMNRTIALRSPQIFQSKSSKSSKRSKDANKIRLMKKVSIFKQFCIQIIKFDNYLKFKF